MFVFLSRAESNRNIHVTVWWKLKQSDEKFYKFKTARSLQQKLHCTRDMGDTVSDLTNSRIELESFRSETDLRQPGACHMDFKKNSNISWKNIIEL